MITIPDAEYDRRQYLGGSNAAAVMGLGAYGNTPLTVYLSKIGQTPEEADPKRELFLQRRKRWEGPIVEMLREEFDGNIVAVNRRYRDAEHDFIAAEIDFEWQDHDGSIQNGEIKTVSPFVFGEAHGWGDAGSADIPVHYAAQNMHGLMVTGRRTCITAAMIGLDNMVFYRIDRDDETIAEMRQRLVSFWRDNVLAKVPPEPVSLEDCMRLTLRMRGKPVEIDDEIEDLLGKLKSIRASKKLFDDDEAGIKFEILNFIRKQWALDPGAAVNDNAVLLRDGRQVASYNLQTAIRIDVESLRQQEPEIAARFSKPSKTRVLRIKKQ